MLLDTSGLLCLLHKDEPQHANAKRIYLAATRRCLTHNYVLAEFIALANARGVPRRHALTFCASAITNPKTEVAWVDENIHRRALELLQTRTDKTYSLCDAASFILMRERGMQEALTTDHDFEQEGFTRLLNP